MSPMFPVTSPRKTRATYWYHWGMVSSSTYVFTVNRLAFAPVWIEEDVTISGLGANVTVAVASSVIRLGIYSCVSGQVGVRLADFGTVASATTGVKTVTGSIGLRVGAYWLAAGSSHAITVTGSLPSDMPGRAPIGYATAFAATAGWAWQTDSHTIDSSTELPAGVPSGLSVLGNTTRAPLLMFQTL